MEKAGEEAYIPRLLKLKPSSRHGQILQLLLCPLHVETGQVKHTVTLKSVMVSCIISINLFKVHYVIKYINFFTESILEENINMLVLFKE